MIVPPPRQDGTPRLVIVTLLPEGDDAGVIRHVETVTEASAGWGTQTTVVDPWSSGRLIRFAFGRMGRLVGRLSRAHGRLIGRYGLEVVVTLKLLRLLLRSSQRTVVYGQDPTSTTAALRLRRILRIDRVVAVAHFNGSEWEEHVDRGTATEGDAVTRMLRRRERRMVSGADLVIVPSQHSLDQLSPRHPDQTPDRFRVVRHAVPLQPPESGPPGDLVTIGTLEPRKRHSYLLEVLAACRRRGRRLQLTIVGDGELRQHLAELADALGVGSSVLFLGRVVPASGHLARHRVYVHAARTESFGLVVAEAMGYGLPVLAGAVGAIPEIVRDGIDGGLWPLDDPEHAASMLLRLIDDHDMYVSASASGRRRYVAQFAPEAALPAWREAILGPSVPQ